MSGILSTSLGRKYAMALSAIFLLIFLIVHLSINLISLFSEEAFNTASYFMSHNFFVQAFMQPILILGVIFHFIMGFVLEIQNNKARPIKYAMQNGAVSSSWMSRNMIISGAVILAFLVLHFADFWVPTIAKNYFGAEHLETEYEHLQEKFLALWRVIAYVICFVLLGLHLAHGFQSSLQSLGARRPEYLPMVKNFGKIYSILIPFGFVAVAIFHYIVQH